MELTFKALILWSEELAKGTQGITIDDPPVKIYPDDFIWIDIILKDVGGKRSLGQTPSGDISPVSNTTPVGNTAPMSAIKRAKVHEELKFRIGSYEEMQGHSINIDYKLVRRLSYDLPIEKYFKYCDLDEAGIEKDVNILATHGIISFRRFLFPEVLDAKTIASWGIKWDTAIELMTRSREYYTYLVAIEEERIERRRIYDDDMEFLRQSELRVPPLNKGKGKAQG
ncbi:uncharacterized protein MELLADRAFT_89131 [Melampsora larici-populina 98AG31]|uniref:Uncharacterized protein n=1 Tax=Melampsora larici-populina (strain 98AG31 / pathotype 3-4-7) TaxID=747676 RepID=F4R522_MELLP|nr:uncharacterized protein MELLADRAFT_89131 [Melampsora larici-populina 98AG31]EGG12348.1 hypothetical protein MELLADRAFT_89131 [Melampsora larici-populina 98AG31]